MKRIVLIILSSLMMFTSLAFSAGEPAKADSMRIINEADAKPASATYYVVDRNDNNRLKDETQLQLVYDDNDRLIDDGMNYYFYDRYGNSVDLGGIDFLWAAFSLDHFFISCDYEIVRNSDGTAITATSFGYVIERKYEFNYTSDGRVKSVVYYQDGVESCTTTYEYDAAHRITSTNSTGVVGKQQWINKKTYYYNEDGTLKKIFITRQRPGDSSKDKTYAYNEYRYNSLGKQESCTLTYGIDGNSNSGAYLFAYGDDGNLEYMDVMVFAKEVEEYRVYYHYDDRPVKPANKQVTATFKPLSGSDTYRMKSQLQIQFSHIIREIDLGAGIYLCDSETGERVYSFDRVSNDGYILNLYLSEYAVTHSFEAGHTYYLEIDENALSFENTDKKFSAGKNGNREWTINVKSIYDQPIAGTFEFTSSKDFDGDKQRVGTASFTYASDYFKGSSSSYNSDLAVLSMDMAIASYNHFDSSKGYTFIEQFLEKLDFKYIEHNEDYAREPEDYTTGVCIAAKAIDEETTLIAIAIRSGNYHSEWYSNFDVGSGTDHNGFSQGRDKAISFLKDYLQGHGIHGKVKFWIAGYSRGSAIANLTAASIIDRKVSGDVQYSPQDDVFAYCFEVPASTRSSRMGDSRYRGIFNIINPYDVVVRMPLQQWGYGRYGRVVILPYDDHKANNDYERYIAAVQKDFEVIYGQPRADLPDRSHIRNLNIIMEKLYSSVPKISLYNKLVEKGLGSITRDLLGKADINSNELPQIIVALAYLLPLMSNDLIPNVFNNGILGLINRIKLVYGIVTFDYDNLMFPHYAEYTLAWMQVMNNTGVLESRIEDSSSSVTTAYHKVTVKVHCPVDVELRTKEDGKLMASIRNDGTISSNSLSINAYIDESGAKVFEMPENYLAFFQIKPTDKGQMSINVITEDLLSGEKLSVISYDELNLEKGKNYKLNVSVPLDPYKTESELYDADEQYIKPVIRQIGQNISTYDVTIKVEGNGEAVGQQDVVSGDYVCLRAEPFEGHSFEGWYDRDGNEISREKKCGFQVTSSTTVIARFIEGQEKPEPEKKDDSGSLTYVIIAAAAAGGLAAVALMARRRKKG